MCQAATRGESHRGGGSTHAWCQVYLPGSGWVEFDPTNGIVGNRDLIRVAVARDARQAIPLHGSYHGNLMMKRAWWCPSTFGGCRNKGPPIPLSLSLGHDAFQTGAGSHQRAEVRPGPPRSTQHKDHPMLIEAGFDIAFQRPAPTPMLLQLNVHPSRDADLLMADRIVSDRPFPMRELPRPVRQPGHSRRGPGRARHLLRPLRHRPTRASRT